MRKGDKIGKYLILQDFIVAGGMSKISFARKGDTEYFIKEFLAPRYPVDGSPGSPAMISKRKTRCDTFELHHKKLNEAIGSKCSFGGNLVYAIDFFRSGTSYYKVSEKIDIASISTKDISLLPLGSILIILKTITHSLKILHELKIVHGDLKPDNILIKQTKTGGYTTKLIDFDNSYFSKNAPSNREEVVGTPEYYSPELAKYIKSDEADRNELTVQSDIFALGVIFSEYLSGQKPVFNKKYNYTWEVIESGNIINLAHNGRTKNLRELLLAMLQKDHAKRPTINNVFETLQQSDVLSELLEKTIDPLTTEDPLRKGSVLKGKGLSISKKDDLKTSSHDSKPKIVDDPPALKGKGLGISKK